MAKRECCMLAHKYDLPDMLNSNWYWSIKLDGMRGIWDGGVSRGLFAPWCTTKRATGLWSRYFNPIYAPDWFLDMLPPTPLDGELWAGIGGHQRVTSICKTGSEKCDPERWRQITYQCYDRPGYADLFSLGLVEVIVNATKKRKIIFTPTIQRWVLANMVCTASGREWANSPLFNSHIMEGVEENEVVKIVQQTYIRGWDIPQWVDPKLNELVEQGHEGIVFRRENSRWQPERSHYLLKHKPWLDDEGVVRALTLARMASYLA